MPWVNVAHHLGGLGSCVRPVPGEREGAWPSSRSAVRCKDTRTGLVLRAIDCDASNREWCKQLQLLQQINTFYWKTVAPWLSVKEPGNSGALKLNPNEMHPTAANTDQLFKLPECYFWWAALHALTISLIFFSPNPVLNNYLGEKVVLRRAGLKYWSSQWAETQENEGISQIWNSLRLRFTSAE